MRHLPPRGRVQVERPSRHQASSNTAIHYGREKLPKDRYAKAVVDPRQTGMMRQPLMQFAAQIPANTPPIGGLPHQLLIGTNIFEEHD